MVRDKIYVPSRIQIWHDDDESFFEVILWIFSLSYDFTDLFWINN